MVNYVCSFCNISTNLKANYTRHLKTKKHITNQNKYDEEEKKGINFSYICPPNTSNSLQHSPPNTSSALQIPPNTSKINEKNCENGELSEIKTEFICEYCDKSFSRIDNLNRHMNNRCKKAQEHLTYKKLFLETKQQLKEEKEEFKKQIEMLLTKVGNTTNHINNTQNIQLNSYGKEDISHITDKMKTELLKIPYGMIPKMIEAVHFNDNKPENKNIALTNKKDNKIKVYTGNKWIYKDKDEIINDLVDGKYFILDSHYQCVSDNLNIVTKSTYEKFRTFFDENDKNLHDSLKKECEFVLLNNR